MCQSKMADVWLGRALVAGEGYGALCRGAFGLGRLTSFGGVPYFVLILTPDPQTLSESGPFPYALPTLRLMPDAPKSSVGMLLGLRSGPGLVVFYSVY
jgi:hypothetical protein